MEITVRFERVYGKVLTYPACPISEKLIMLTGLKTFSKEHIAIIKDLGYIVNVEVVSI